MINKNLIKIICKISISKICGENLLLYKGEKIDQSLKLCFVVEKIYSDQT